MRVIHGVDVCQRVRQHFALLCELSNLLGYGCTGAGYSARIHYEHDGLRTR
jgi:hypothetical protein